MCERVTSKIVRRRVSGRIGEAVRKLEGGGDDWIEPGLKGTD